MPAKDSRNNRPRRRVRSQNGRMSSRSGEVQRMEDFFAKAFRLSPPFHRHHGTGPDAVLKSVISIDSLKLAHRRIEVELIMRAMSMHHGNVARMARELQVSRTTLYRKLREYDLEAQVSSTLLRLAS